MTKRKKRVGQSYTKTPKGLRTSGRASDVRVIRPDGSEEVVPSYTKPEMDRIVGPEKRKKRK